jgi:hypothetical protein
MRLTKVAILALKGLDKKARERIAETANRDISTLNRWIADNDDNLTKAAISGSISKEIGLPVEEILEESEVKEPAK